MNRRNYHKYKQAYLIIIGRDMPYIKIKRYMQDAGMCAVAAASSVANFYDKSINYEIVKNIADNDGDGLFTSELSLLLNNIGFYKVTVISSDINQLDFSWKDYSKNRLISVLKKSVKKNKDSDYKNVNRKYIEFLSKKCDNNLIIDYQFGKYIRKYIDEGKPILTSFNWNLFFQCVKWSNGRSDAINGEYEEHEVVICGYDDVGVDVVDSHHEMYKGKLSKFKNGRYRISWETLMTVMGNYGDLIIPENFKGLLDKKV